MAEQVAVASKNNGDGASMLLSGANLEDFEMLKTASKVGLERSLAELSHAIHRLFTKEEPAPTGASTRPGLPVATQVRGAVLRFWFNSESAHCSGMSL